MHSAESQSILYLVSRCMVFRNVIPFTGTIMIMIMIMIIMIIIMIIINVVIYSCIFVLYIL